MKKTILFLVAFMLLGLSFAKAQFENGNYTIAPESRGYANRTTKVSLMQDKGFLMIWHGGYDRSLEIRNEGNGYYSIMSGGNYLTAEGNMGDKVVFRSTKSDYSLWSFPENRFWDTGQGNIRMRTHSILNKATGTYLDAPRSNVSSGTYLIHYKEQRNPNSKTMDANQCWFIRKI